MSILMYKQRFRNPNYRKTPKGNYAHIGYIATRPGVSKNDDMRHGLFGKLSPGALTEFETWQEAARVVRELSYRRVNMYRSIISFSPDTAAELGLAGHQEWEDYIERHVMTMAKKNGIRAENLSWVAAHHNERGHPHCHIVFWDKNQRTRNNFTKPEIPNSIRIQLIKDTFADKIRAYCEAKDRLRGQIGDITDELVGEFDEYIKKIKPKEYKRLQEIFGRIGDDELAASPMDNIVADMDLAPFIGRLFSLKDKMPKKGRLYYKLLPEDVKAEVDAFIAELKDKNEYIRNLVKDYADSKLRLVMLYESNPDNMYEHWQKAVDDADKLIANKILGVIKSMLNKDYELAGFEYTESRKQFYTEQMICEIMLLLERNIMSFDDEYDIKNMAVSTELSKAAKKEWYLKHKDQGMEL